MFSQEIKIDNSVISSAVPPYIIAEAGISHFGSLDKAFELCDLAKNGRADAIKFQIFKTENLYASEAEDWRNRLKSRELSAESYREVSKYCKKIGLTFFLTAHDIESLDSIKDFEMPAIKIGSGEKGNFPYFEKVINFEKPIIISLGMYSEEEVESLISFFIERKKSDVVFLHCVTNYPATPESINLKSISYLRDKHGVLMGYSDHTKGHHIAEASVHYGACVIEKHITLEYDIPNAQDWKVSCGPTDLATFCSNVRQTFAAVGSYGKNVQPEERDNIAWATKSIYYHKNMSKGTRLTEKDIVIKRPGNYLGVKSIEDLVGKVLKINVKEDKPIGLDDFYE